MAPPIANILHQETIRRLSGDGAFERGRLYAAQGRVVDVVRKDGAIAAKVRGTETYEVRIWMHEESLAYSCNCPQGQEQAFCKHAVAVALSFVGAIVPTPKTPPVDDRAPPQSPPSTPAAPPPAAPTPAPIRKASPREAPASFAAELRALSHEALVLLILEESLEDAAFRARVLARLTDPPRS
jgi:hypothetical protein